MLDHKSNMKESSDVNERVAARLRELRAERGWSLDALARRSGVSRSMISVIERGESSATAVVLDRLATALGVMLASLFDAPVAHSAARADPVARRVQQAVWRDPQSGYERRNVSPAAAPSVRLVDVQFPAGARVAFETGPRAQRIGQLVWVLEGAIDVTVGSAVHRLAEGDCLAMQLDEPTMFHNPTRRAARYAVVISQEGLA